MVMDHCAFHSDCVARFYFRMSCISAVCICYYKVRLLLTNRMFETCLKPTYDRILSRISNGMSCNESCFCFDMVPASFMPLVTPEPPPPPFVLMLPNECADCWRNDDTDDPLCCAIVVELFVAVRLDALFTTTFVAPIWRAVL